jgi:uncharacterized protein YxeA
VKILKSRNIWVISIVSIISIIIVLIAASIISHNIKLNKYTQYLKDKYGVSDSEIRFKSYKKENYAYEADFYGPYKRKVPSIITYEVKGRTVKVVDNGTTICDDYQIEDISYIAAEHFSKITGYNVEFVEFNSNSIYGNGFSDSMSEYMQTTNNSVISLDNIEDFLVGYKNFDPNLFTSINLYINITSYDDLDTLVEDIDAKLFPYIKRTNLYNMGIWLYQGNGQKLEIIRSSLRNSDILPNYFCNYYVYNLDNIIAYLFCSNRKNFRQIGNFSVDERGIWFFSR